MADIVTAATASAPNLSALPLRQIDSVSADGGTVSSTVGQEMAQPSLREHVGRLDHDRRVDRLRIDLDRGDCSVTTRRYFDCAASARRIDRAFRQVRLDLFHLLLHARSLFH